MASQKNLSEAAFSDDLQEVEVGGLRGRVRRRPQVYLLRRTGLQDETGSQSDVCHSVGASCTHKHRPAGTYRWRGVARHQLWILLWCQGQDGIHLWAVE